MRILTVGDVYGRTGLDFIAKRLWGLRKLYGAELTVVNGENCAGNGLTPANARALYDAGADVITLGNHTFGRREIADYLDDEPNIIRPANWPKAPGNGLCFYRTDAGEACVINLIGRVDLPVGAESPFDCADRLIERARQRTNVIIIDFHAEATSEKNALAWYLDGRASVLFGTHTHVQTADERVLPGGLGYITDLGMTGAVNSVIGVSVERSVAFFRGDMLGRFEDAGGAAQLCGALFEVGADGRCTAVQRLRVE